MIFSPKLDVAGYTVAAAQFRPECLGTALNCWGVYVNPKDTDATNMYGVNIVPDFASTTRNWYGLYSSKHYGTILGGRNLAGKFLGGIEADEIQATGQLNGTNLLVKENANITNNLAVQNKIYANSDIYANNDIRMLYNKYIYMGAYTQISSSFDMRIGILANTDKITGLDFKNENNAGWVRLITRDNNNNYAFFGTSGTSVTGNFLGVPRSKYSYLAQTGSNKGLAIGTLGNANLVLGTNDKATTYITPAGNFNHTGYMNVVGAVTAIGSTSTPSILAPYVSVYIYNNGGTYVGRLIPYNNPNYLDMAFGAWNGGNPNIMLTKEGKVGIGLGKVNATLQVGGTIIAEGVVPHGNATDTLGNNSHYWESLYVVNAKAVNYLDKTPAYTKGTEAALNEILSIETKDGKINHDTLDFTKTTVTECVEYKTIKVKSSNCEVGESCEYDTEVCVKTEEKEYRDLGKTITLLVEAVKELKKENDRIRENQITTR
jgi:hypothetical protein